MTAERITRDELGLLLARVWSLRGTCARRRVGCVLVDADGFVLSSGYNGPAAGQAHCIDRPCLGAGLPSGTGLDLCESVHAESNSIIQCGDPRRIHTAYVTASPCIHCVKILLNTGCQTIVFAEPYAHDQASRELWTRPTKAFPLGRSWIQGMDWNCAPVDLFKEFS